MSTSYTLLTRKPGGEDGLVADNTTMKQVSSGLHGTCRKSDIIWPDLTIIQGTTCVEEDAETYYETIIFYED